MEECVALYSLEARSAPRDETRSPKATRSPRAMNESNATGDLEEVLASVGLDMRAGTFIMLMLAVGMTTLMLGSAILICATCASRRRAAEQQVTQTQSTSQSPEIVGNTAAALANVQVSLPEERQGLTTQEPQPVSLRRRQVQVLLVFLCTFALCLVVTLSSLSNGRLTKETGLPWESYLFLLSSGCVWLLVPAAVLAKTLPTGRGYGNTAFLEAMLGGIMPFIADSFDTLKDTMFGVLCLASQNLCSRSTTFYIFLSTWARYVD